MLVIRIRMGSRWCIRMGEGWMDPDPWYGHWWDVGDGWERKARVRVAGRGRCTGEEVVSSDSWKRKVWEWLEVWDWKVLVMAIDVGMAVLG